MPEGKVLSGQIRYASIDFGRDRHDGGIHDQQGLAGGSSEAAITMTAAFAVSIATAAYEHFTGSQDAIDHCRAPRRVRLGSSVGADGTRNGKIIAPAARRIVRLILGAHPGQRAAFGLASVPIG